ncbi:mucoidy inhibitor MuiA family protein [Emticicia sp. CRIBPO]|uniref:DUF4139 domain-containing protein n=1 Tax=Emticicia sp. CRIBPO TaxID=2683258 RepID=UPI001413587D|nr:DUF4139 domain-containing protein [Emticicia sp. CRIBPO]NBA87975.1 mucoidy inhibitor MuiA family protein [Emticicia sp. CRIBPO]
MKFLSVLILSAGLFTQGRPLHAQQKQQPVASKIEKVTIFTSGAQVTRRAKVNVAQGKTELVFSGISPNIDKQSIQVKGEGKFTIVSVVHQVNHLNEQKKREETSVLEDKKEDLKQKLIFERSMLAVFKNEENMLIKNQSIGGNNTGLKTSDLKEAVDFQRSRFTEVLLKQSDLNRNIKKLDSMVLKIDSQLKALNQTKDLSTSEIWVTVTSKENVAGSFEVSYFVKDAGWYATYDLRVEDIASPLDLSFKANVFQHSGEDWKDVSLTISNGNPTESGIAPQLKPWRLGFGYPENEISEMLKGRIAGMAVSGLSEVKGRVTDKSTGEALPGASILVAGTSIGTSTDVSGNYTIKLPVNAQSLKFNYIGYEPQEVPLTGALINVGLVPDTKNLSEVVVTGYGVQKKGLLRNRATTSSIPVEIEETFQATSVSFEIEMPYTIPNDGKTYKVDVKNQSVPAIYEYYAAPKLEKEAFLTAKVTDWQEFNLLEGEVNLFFEGAYLGKSVLDVRNAGDTLNISLGRDKGIVVERKKLKDFTKKQFMSNYKTESRGYEIIVRNNKKQAVNIMIQDQFPVSTQKEISIEEKEYKEAELNPTTKILTWKQQVAAKQEKKFSFVYSVKYPKDQVVVLE